MKKIITLISAVLFTSTIFAQAYGAPESIEFDYAHNRWLISNPNFSNILSRDSQTGVVTVFATGANGPQGLEIVNDTLYSCEGTSIHLYNINTGVSIVNINCGATYLNGITHDNSGNIYATDFTAKKIHRLNTATRQHNIFVTGLVKQPDGIIYDQPNNRCVFVNWGANAPIMSVNLADSTTANIVAASGLGNNDGITKDGAGNYYISSWTGNKVTRYDNTFTTSTTVINTGLSSPADIFYNTVTDTLGVPNSGGNNTKYYYFGSSIGINEIANSNFNLTVSPNPVGERAEINYEINADGKVTIQLFDIKGQLVKTIAEENQVKGKHFVLFDKTGLSTGNYLLKLTNNNSEETKKVIVK